ncbi:MFS transporter [Pseudomonas sp. NPDC089918]|uniref:MFS transporter n=1 Tax=Pseudomonas sp. NPDC089918 TaxID=3390654 RepID=UPI003D042B4A
MVSNLLYSPSERTPKYSTSLRIAQGITAALAFSILLAGTNATTPMLPLYHQVLSFTPLMMSLTFVCYVSVLIGVLLICSHPTFVRWSSPMLCLSLLVAAISDVFLSTATGSGILLGRAIAGIAGGIGTGSAAALVVAALGSLGRSLSATGNLIGAVAGTAFAQACIALWGAAAMRWTFLFHGVVCLFLLIALSIILVLRHQDNSKLLCEVSKGKAVVWSSIRNHPIALTVGCLSWITISAAIVSLPSFYAALEMGWISAYGIIILLAFSAAGQLCSPWLGQIAPWSSGVATITAGIIFLLLGADLRLSSLATIGFAVIGMGIGVSYRLGLITFTKGSSPAQQGALSSFYAAITYGAAAACALALGIAGNEVGLHMTVIILFGILAALTLLLSGKAPCLGNTRE